MIENNSYESLKSCRYCQTDDFSFDLVSPCSCKGSIQYVHKKCLKEWLNKKNEQFVIPANFNQFNLSCEICHTKYNIVYENNEQSKKLCKDISIYLSIISLALFISYFLLGLFAEKVGIVFLENDSEVKFVLFNGFILTHIILGIFYITVLFYSCFHNQTCCFCYFGEPTCKCDNCDEGCCIIVLAIIAIIGILGTILIIYYDMISRVIQRHKNQTKIIKDILPVQEQV